MAKAKIVPVQAAAPVAAAEAASGLGGAVVKALTTPIHTRVVHERWDPEKEMWVPDTRDRATNLTPAALLTGGAIGVAAAAVAQRGLRTGTVGLKTEHEFKSPNARLGIWLSEGEPTSVLDPAKGPWVPAGRTRRRPVVRTRENIADYQPIGRVLG